MSDMDFDWHKIAEDISTSMKDSHGDAFNIEDKAKLAEKLQEAYTAFTINEALYIDGMKQNRVAGLKSLRTAVVKLQNKDSAKLQAAIKTVKDNKISLPHFEHEIKLQDWLDLAGQVQKHIDNEIAYLDSNTEVDVHPSTVLIGFDLSHLYYELFPGTTPSRKEDGKRVGPIYTFIGTFLQHIKKSVGNDAIRQAIKTARGFWI